MDATSKTKELLALLIVFAGWLLIMAAVPALALWWRVEYEPGAAKTPELLWAALCFLASGGLLFLAANLYLILKKSKVIYIAWLLCLAACLLACGFTPILLIFLV